MTDTKFKVGDKVRVRPTSMEVGHRGLVGTIIEVDDDDVPYLATFDSRGTRWFYADELEAAPAELKIGDRVVFRGGQGPDHLIGRSGRITARDGSAEGSLPWLVNLGEEYGGHWWFNAADLMLECDPDELASPEYAVEDDADTFTFGTYQEAYDWAKGRADTYHWDVKVFKLVAEFTQAPVVRTYK